MTLHLALTTARLLHRRPQLHIGVLPLHLRVDLLHESRPLGHLLPHLASALASLASSLASCHLVLLMKTKIFLSAEGGASNPVGGILPHFPAPNL